MFCKGFFQLLFKNETNDIDEDLSKLNLKYLFNFNFMTSKLFNKSTQNISCQDTLIKLYNIIADAIKKKNPCLFGINILVRGEKHNSAMEKKKKTRNKRVPS